MKHLDHENKYPNNEVGRKQYDAAMDGTGDAGKGVHMYKRPYLWKEANPVHPMLDTPAENFIPTPTINVGEDEIHASPIRKAVKIGLIVLLIAFMIFGVVALLLERPDLFHIKPSSSYKIF